MSSAEGFASDLAAPKVVLDPWYYAAHLFGAGAVPWADDAQFIAFARKANALLKPDRLVVPLVDWAKAVIGAMPELAKRAAERSRTPYPLKTFLGEPALKARLSEFGQAIVGVLPASSVSFHLGVSDDWLNLAYQAAHARAPDAIDEDVREQAGAILAGFLPALAGLQFDGLLLGAEDAVADRAFFESQTPILNLSSHYRWSVGLVCKALDASLRPGIDWVAQPSGDAGSSGLVIAASAWADLEPLTEARLYFARIPSNANPEMVLARLARIKDRGKQS